jgi:hypothetical protein
VHAYVLQRRNVGYAERGWFCRLLGVSLFSDATSKMPRPLCARSTTIKRAKTVRPNPIDPERSRTQLKHTKTVIPNPIDPERSRTPSAWRRSMLWWVDVKKVFFLPPGRGPSAGRRRAIEMRCALRTATPSTLVLPALQEQQIQATPAQTCKTCVCAAAVCFLVLLLSRGAQQEMNFQVDHQAYGIRG